MFSNSYVGVIGASLPRLTSIGCGVLFFNFLNFAPVMSDQWCQIAIQVWLVSATPPPPPPWTAKNNWQVEETGDDGHPSSHHHLPRCAERSTLYGAGGGWRNPPITLSKQAHPPNPRQERKKERRSNVVELPQPDPDTPRVEFLSTI